MEPRDIVGMLEEIAEGLITPEVLARESEIEAEEELAASFETPIL